jgi:GBP family porin
MLIKYGVLSISAAMAASLMCGRAFAQDEAVTNDAKIGYNSPSEWIPDISSVTLFGKVETGLLYGKYNSNVPALASVWNGTSAYGLRGSESLGGGLLAFFFLEESFKATTGAATAGMAFTKGSYVGLQSNELGRLELGRMHTPLYWSYNDSDVNRSFDDSSLTAIKMQYNTLLGFAANSDYYNNGIYYATPAFKGLQADVAYSFGAENAGFQPQSQKQFGWRLRYHNGPLVITYGSNEYFYYPTSKSTHAASWNSYVVAGTYDLGFVKFGTNYAYARRTDTGWFGSSWQVNAAVPIGPRTDVNIGTARLLQTGGMATQDFSLEANYHFSKRTLVYIEGLYYHNNSKGTVGSDILSSNYTTVTPGFNSRAVSVGIKTKF